MSHLKDAQLEAQARVDISQRRRNFDRGGPKIQLRDPNFSVMKIVAESQALRRRKLEARIFRPWKMAGKTFPYCLLLRALLQTTPRWKGCHVLQTNALALLGDGAGNAFVYVSLIRSNPFHGVSGCGLFATASAGICGLHACEPCLDVRPVRIIGSNAPENSGPYGQHF
jgi:hypothetical protein